MDALLHKKKVLLHFYSKEDGGLILIRTCAPMDFGPSRRAHLKNDRYHLWDYDSDTRVHTLSLSPEQMLRILPIEEAFDPAEFITWSLQKSPWFTPREWGQYSLSQSLQV